MIVPSSNVHKYVCPTPKCGTKISIADLEAVFQDELAEFLHQRKEALREILSTDPDLAEKRSQLTKLQKGN